MGEIFLTKKQSEYIREAHHRWNFAIGAVRSGKSHIALQYIIPQCLTERKGKKGLNFILGASYGNIIRNVLEPMTYMWGDKLIDYKGSAGRCFIFGEPVVLLGADNKRAANRLRGSEIKFCYIDEVCDINHETFDMLASRLSLSYSVCHASANPSNPNHFVKEFIDKADNGVDIYCQHFTIYDNPFLPKEYVSNLEAEYSGTVYYDRYILGKWTKAEGLVWPMFTEAFGKIPGPPEDIALSMDYGTLNPFACLLWLKHKGVWYADRGYYYSGGTENWQKTDGDYADDIEYFIKDYLEKRMLAEKNTGITQPRIKTIIDPSASSFITLMRRKQWCKVIHANNRVIDGIRNTATAMQTGLIKINPDIREWKDEVNGYVWDERHEDCVVKENDHYMDATRYFVETMGLVRDRKEYTPLWNY